LRSDWGNGFWVRLSNLFSAYSWNPGRGKHNICRALFLVSLVIEERSEV